MEIGYLLAGGQGHPDPALGACLELLHAGSLIVDDIQDGSEQRRGAPTLHRSHGLGTALNAGNWLYFAALEELGRSSLPAETTLRAYRLLARTLLLCHQGQGLDLAARVDVVPAERLAATAGRITALKTGELMRLAASLGALGAASTRGARDVTEPIGRFGFEMGVALQMLDDRSGVTNPARADKGAEDLTLRRVTWPWAWAFEARGHSWVAALQGALAAGAEVCEVSRSLREAMAESAPRSIRKQLRRAREAAAELDEDAGLAAANAELDRLEGAYE